MAEVDQTHLKPRPVYPIGTWHMGVKGYVIMSIWMRTKPNSPIPFGKRCHIVACHIKRGMKNGRYTQA